MTTPAEKNTDINLKELAGHADSMHWVASKHQSSKQLYVLDSLVAIFALAKGRSASRAINNVLRSKILVPSLAFDHYAGYVYGPSALMPADDLTRDVGLRSPSAALPKWLKLLKTGDPSLFDYVASLPFQNNLPRLGLVYCRHAVDD